MAKKTINLAEMPVEERLKNLYQLQTILTEIDRIRTLRGELPLEVEDLEDTIEGLKTRIENIKGEIKELRKTINGLTGDAEKANAQLEKFKEQQNNVSNSREYDVLVKQIEFQELEIMLADKRIKEARTQMAAKEEYLQRSTADMEGRMVDLDMKKNELDEIIAETKADEEKLREKAKALEAQIEPRLLMSFKRIRKNTRNGLGIVYVQRDACGGCFAKIPPQRQLDVRMRKKIIVCEYCGRILVDPELAGVKTDAPQGEEKSTRKRGTTTRKKSTTTRSKKAAAEEAPAVPEAETEQAAE